MTEEKNSTAKKEKASINEIKKDLQNEKLGSPIEKKGYRMKAIGTVRNFKDRVNTEVIERSKKAEKIHKSIASWPLDQVSKVNRFEQIAKDLNAVQQKAIRHAYDLLRTAVKKADEINNDIIAIAEKRWAVS